jgi:hypothetical protein
MNMALRTLTLLLSGLILSGCSTYPFGSGGYGNYFGGQGPGPDPLNYVPAQIAQPR